MPYSAPSDPETLHVTISGEMNRGANVELWIWGPNLLLHRLDVQMATPALDERTLRLRLDGSNYAPFTVGADGMEIGSASWTDRRERL